MTAASAEPEPSAPAFADLGLPAELVDALSERGITTPFPIQVATIPDALAGRDVCGQAQTGSGKTLAFGLPMIVHAATSRQQPCGLVLVPTRELANQVAKELEPLAVAHDQKIVVVYGGTSIPRQIEALRVGADIVIATPGRLIDLLNRRALQISDVEVVTIDEADQMADMGFLPQVRQIMRQVAGEHQTLLFSATLEGEIGALTRAYMTDPVRHAVEGKQVSVEQMEHRFIKVHHMDKVRVAAAIANAADRTLVFVRTKFGADGVAKALRDVGVNTNALHGGKFQSKREKTLRDFADGVTPVLVATNVAARGLHIEGVDVVIHYDPPEDPKTYVHRSGRTARAGEEGVVVTLVEWDQVNEVLRLQKQAGVESPIEKMFSNDPRLRDLASWTPEDKVERPATRAEAARRRSRSGARRRRR